MSKSAIKIGSGKATGTNLGTGNQIFVETLPANNLNFRTLVGTGGISISISSGATELIISGGSGTASGERIEKTYIQTSHGFSVGNVVSYEGTTFVKAIADNTQIGEVLGFVNEIIDSNTFTVVFAGYIEGITALGLNASTTYFVSTTVAGDLQPTNPSNVNEISKPILTTLTTDDGIVFQYRGFLVESGGTGGGSDGVVSGGTLNNGNLILNRTEGLNDVSIDLTSPLPDMIGNVVGSTGTLTSLYNAIATWTSLKIATGEYLIQTYSGTRLTTTNSILQLTPKTLDTNIIHNSGTIYVNKITDGTPIDSDFNVTAYIIPDPCVDFNLVSLTQIDDANLKYIDVEVFGTNGNDFTIAITDVQTSDDVVISGGGTKTGDATYRVQVTDPSFARDYNVDIIGTSGTIVVCSDSQTINVLPVVIIPPAPTQPKIFIAVLPQPAGFEETNTDNEFDSLSVQLFDVKITTDSGDTQNGISGSQLIEDVSFDIIVSSVNGNIDFTVPSQSGNVGGIVTDPSSTINKILTGLTLSSGFTEGYVTFGIQNTVGNLEEFDIEVINQTPNNSWGEVTDTSDSRYVIKGSVPTTYGYEIINGNLVFVVKAMSGI